MPISPNLNLGSLGSRFAMAAASAAVPAAPQAPAAPAAPAAAAVMPSVATALATMPEVAAPAAPVPATAPVAPTAPVAATAAVPARALATLPAAALSSVLNRLPSLILTTPAPKTTTQLARGAIAQLGQLPPQQVRKAMNTVVNAGLTGAKLMPHLEQYVRIGEVLNEVAARWSEPTRAAFISAMRTQPDQIENEVMDAIVSLAITSDADLDQELKVENTPETTTEELATRKVVWQSVAPGAPLDPPYVIVVAVEYTDVVKAEEAVKAITGNLIVRDGFRLPREIADRV